MGSLYQFLIIAYLFILQILLLLIIIIKTLFQEDNIFGTYLLSFS